MERGRIFCVGGGAHALWSLPSGSCKSKKRKTIRRDMDGVKRVLDGGGGGGEKPVGKPCFLYVRVQAHDIPPPGRSGLEAILKCGILGYVLVRRVPTPAYKVKIEAHLLPDALVNACHNGCFADVWLGSSGFYTEGPLHLNICVGLLNIWWWSGNEGCGWLTESCKLEL